MNILSMKEVEEIHFKMNVEKYADVWKEKARVLKVAEAEETEARTALIAACNNQNFEGCGVKIESIERKGAIEYKAIPELAEVNVEDFRKPSSVYWTVKLSLKE